MGNILTLKYDEVVKFSKALDKRIKNVDKAFENVVERGMENTLKEAEKDTPVRTGELKSSWRKDVEVTRQKGRLYIKEAENRAYNEEAAEYFGNDDMGYYAKYVEKGHAPVPWRKSTHGVHMLANAEIDTERELQGIVDDEIKKLFGGLFD